MHIGDIHAGEVATDLCVWLLMVVLTIGALLLVVSLVRQSHSQTSENESDNEE
jgi:uncharacterized membrane protein